MIKKKSIGYYLGKNKQAAKGNFKSLTYLRGLEIAELKEEDMPMV